MMTSYNCVILTGKVSPPFRRQYRPDGSQVIQFFLELDEVNPDPALKSGALGSSRIYSIHPRDKSRGFLRGGVKDLRGQEQLQDDRRPALKQTGSGGLINIVVIGKLAESNSNLFQSGQHLLVVGRLKQRRWQTPEGKKQTRTEVIAMDLKKSEEVNDLSALPAVDRAVRLQIDSIKKGEKNEETC